MPIVAYVPKAEAQTALASSDNDKPLQSWTGDRPRRLSTISHDRFDACKQNKTNADHIHCRLRVEAEVQTASAIRVGVPLGPLYHLKKSRLIVLPA